MYHELNEVGGQNFPVCAGSPSNVRLVSRSTTPNMIRAELERRNAGPGRCLRGLYESHSEPVSFSAPHSSPAARRNDLVTAQEVRSPNASPFLGPSDTRMVGDPRIYTAIVRKKSQFAACWNGIHSGVFDITVISCLVCK